MNQADWLSLAGTGSAVAWAVLSRPRGRYVLSLLKGMAIGTAVASVFVCIYMLPVGRAIGGWPAGTAWWRVLICSLSLGAPVGMLTGVAALDILLGRERRRQKKKAASVSPPPPQ